MSKIDIKNLSKAELEDSLEDMGAEAYRSGQIFRWLYGMGAGSFDDMTVIANDLRARLKIKYHITHLTLLDSRSSAADGTTKYLFKLEDANTIETVFLPEPKRATICLSSQVGCKFSCSFCASAPFGFVRNLKSSEILDEVLAVKRKNPQAQALRGTTAAAPSAQLTNLVFMGIGEPLDNYDNVMKAIRVFNDKDAFNIGARKITISTCGIIPGIRKLAAENLQIELSVSLHSADDKVRSKIVPINKRYPLKDLIATCREYTEKTRRIITFEYVMIKGVNCSKDDALKLARLLTGLHCKVNTISYNKIKAKDYAEPTGHDVRVFMDALKAGGINAIHRKSKGEDIDAGCGQLRISKF